LGRTFTGCIDLPLHGTLADSKYPGRLACPSVIPLPAWTMPASSSSVLVRRISLDAVVGGEVVCPAEPIEAHGLEIVRRLGWPELPVAAVLDFGPAFLNPDNRNISRQRNAASAARMIAAICLKRGAPSLSTPKRAA
jgi:hypothetical protein